MKKKIAEL